MCWFSAPSTFSMRSQENIVILVTRTVSPVLLCSDEKAQSGPLRNWKQLLVVGDWSSLKELRNGVTCQSDLFKYPLPLTLLSCWLSFSPHFQSTPFDNFLNPSVPRPVLGTEEQTGEEAKMRKLKRGATLRWFKETQAQKVMQDDGAFPSWLHGMISRRWVLWTQWPQ